MQRDQDKGQVIILVVVVLALFLLAFMGFATDYTHFWYQKQKAQTMADTTCEAAGMDLLLSAEGQATPNMNFTPGTAFDCASAPTAAPCIIAGYNDTKNGGALQATTAVSVSFPPSFCPPSGCITPPPPAEVPYPFVQVDVIKTAPAYFSRVLTGNSTVPIHSTATCGIENPLIAPPIIVLHPTMASSLHAFGNATISIYGGPSRSIQVNSNNATAADIGNNADTINLSQGGPKASGSDLATFGGTATQSSGVDLGSTGSYVYPAPPISDPYAGYPPVNPSTLPIGVHTTGILGGTQGCPLPPTMTCEKYTYGRYTTKIVVNGNGSLNEVAIFDPGIYYVSGLSLEENSNVRVSTNVGDGSGGVMFYFYGDGTINHGSCHNANLCVLDNSGTGKTQGGIALTSFPVSSTFCPGNTAPLPPPLTTGPAITGNVFVGQCSGTYSYTDKWGAERGFVFFQDHAGLASTVFGGGGADLLAGLMYFHNSGYGNVVHLRGGSGSNSYVVGSLVTDQIDTGGTPNITMILNPEDSFPVLKVMLLK